MKKIVFLSLLLTLSLKAFAGELADREKIKNDVKEMIYTENFLGLETMAKKFRENESRTSSGVWKLTIYYSGISEILSYQTVDTDKWEELLRKIDLWRSIYPESPTPYIAKSLILIRQAWSIRGTGYSNTVPNERWAPFYEKIEESRKILMESQSISKADPTWYVTMSDIATIQSWDQEKFENLVNEGLNENPYFYQLYFSAMYYYTPKWHGNAEKIEKFAQSALNRTKKKERNGMYARIYWFASQSQFKGKLFQKSGVDWGLMSKGIDDVLSKYPDQWNINNFAYFACKARDKKKTKKLLGLIEGEPIKSAWQNKTYIFNQCNNWAKAG